MALKRRNDKFQAIYYNGKNADKVKEFAVTLGAAVGDRFTSRSENELRIFSFEFDKKIDVPESTWIVFETSNLLNIYLCRGEDVDQLFGPFPI